MKGFYYTVSPLPAVGLHFQTGIGYSFYHERNLEERDGYIWMVPLSLNFGDGYGWEVSAGTHLEYWKNTDYDMDESGLGDFVIGGKIRILKSPFHFALMPYFGIPSGGDRGKHVGDLLHANPGSENDPSFGLNLLFGKWWGRTGLVGNIGIHYTDTDLPEVKKASWIAGLALEYQIAETWDSYIEVISIGNKNDPAEDSGLDEDTDEDMWELGAGLVFVKNRWGFKGHVGIGFAETSPDVRGQILINRSFSFEPVGSYRLSPATPPELI